VFELVVVEILRLVDDQYGSRPIACSSELIQQARVSTAQSRTAMRFNGDGFPAGRGLVAD